MDEEQSKLIHEMREYKSRLLEKKAIHNDMKPKLDRIRTLNKQMHDIESRIISYMHNKGHEAIRFDNCLFKIKKKNKTRATPKLLKENLKQILNQSKNVDPVLYSQLTDIFENEKMKTEKESIDCVLPSATSSSKKADFL
jgi:hypothetical protein